MDFAFSDEQEAFRETLRRFLAERSPLSETRRHLEGPAGFDPALWRALADELGLPGIAVAEAHGGQGFGTLELGIVMEELGRALAAVPFLATAGLAIPALQHVGGEADHAAWLPALAAGEATATLAWVEPGVAWVEPGVARVEPGVAWVEPGVARVEPGVAWVEPGAPGGGWAPEAAAMKARRDGAHHVLEGRKRFVLHGAAADLVLVVARDETGGLSLFAAESGAAGLRAEPTETLDPTRRQADLVLDGVRARPVGAPGAAGPGLARALHEAAVHLALESVGAAQACLDMAVAYAKERVQFGRPIGGFQAVKHKCAEMLLELELARPAAYWAAWAAAEGDAELPLAASLAKACCAETFLACAAENIQIHGGIGVTWEADPHLYYVRAKTSEELLGDPAFHRARVAEAVIRPGRSG